MLKGLALTPPVIGRIAIGRVVEKAGRRLPEKDDEFTLTSQVQNRDGWLLHPLDEALRQQAGGKLRCLPVRLLFNDPSLNLRADFHLFDRTTGRPLCVGNGETCKRVTQDGMQSLPCPSPDACSLAKGGACKPYGRLNVIIGDDDPLGSFVFRTTGFNSLRTLQARLRYFHAVSGGLLADIPLALRLRGKSTTMSYRTPVYYVDLTLRTGQGLMEVVARARQQRAQAQAMGLDQGALDEAARQGLALGAFEESEEEGVAVVEEFYPPEDGGLGPRTSSQPTGLERKLARKRDAASPPAVLGAVHG